MCRSIKTLRRRHDAPAVSPDEVRAAALQFVRKVSGYRVPSKANEVAFLTAVDDVEAAVTTLLASLATHPGPATRQGVGGQAALDP